ncbi:hypothetical protein AZE42_11945 [Rhizopogon vesiculosus]|uniref:Uncharacterized protein n=1 Tax=Rhizopogon vesiculosus TaxID=180088 RepID=A0A1J8QF09_9AGAM|nr:hypothetical protein AZE42_11945 [Rhizopogon vesiculosus]
MKDTLAKLWDNAQNLRFRAHSATTLLDEYLGFFKGLSYSIAVACSQVKELRASIIRLTRKEAEQCGASICADYSLVRQPPSSTLPQICCAERSVPSPQLDFPVHLHARRTKTLLRLIMYHFAYMTSRPSRRSSATLSWVEESRLMRPTLSRMTDQSTMSLWDTTALQNTALLQ